MSTQTWTLDVTTLDYIDKDGIKHRINADETLTLEFTDLGTGGRFQVLIGGGKIVCTDGFTFEPHAESRFEFLSTADENTHANGEIAFIEEGNVLNVFRVAELNMTNADGTGANNVVSITLEQVANNARKMIWTNIDTA